MVLDPFNAWALVRDNKVIHVRLSKGIIEACASIEKEVYGHNGLRIVPVMLTEILDQNDHASERLEQFEEARKPK